MDTIEAESLVQMMLNVSEMETGKSKKALTRNQMVDALSKLLPSDGSEEDHFKQISDLTSLMFKFFKGYHADMNAAIEMVYSESRKQIDKIREHQVDANFTVTKLTRATERAEKLLERYESIHSDRPVKETTSLNPERFVCRVCGTAMGRVDLDGTGRWAYKPRFCPGCGAPVSYGDEGEKPAVRIL